MLLDKIDHIDKTELTAKCFNSFIKNEINHEYFIDLAAVISKSTLSDLNSLCVSRNERVTFKSITMAASSGILDYGIFKNDENQPEMGHRLSDFGTDIRDIFLGEESSRYTRKLEQKEQSKRRSKKWEARHIQSSAKARKMKSEGMTNDKIAEKLKIDKYLLENYLSNSKYDS